MSRHTAMQRPPRLSIVDADAIVDDEAPTCSVRDSRAALAGLPVRPPARSGVSYIEDSDVVSSIGHDPDRVTSFAARPSYVAQGEIVTGETPTFLPRTTTIPTLDSADVAMEPGHALLGLTREEPLVAPPQDVGGDTLLLTPTPMASVRPVYRSQMMSVPPPPPDSWVETPWVMPSVRDPSFASPAPVRDAKSILQTIAIVGTGVLMLAIVFGAVLFARSDSEEQQQMQFSPQRSAAAAQAIHAAAPVAPVAPDPTMQVISAPVTPTPTPLKPHANVAATPRVKELPPRTRVDGPKPVAKEKAEPAAAAAAAAGAAGAKKTKEEESVEALLKKLGEEQLSR